MPQPRDEWVQKRRKCERKGETNGAGVGRDTDRWRESRALQSIRDGRGKGDNVVGTGVPASKNELGEVPTQSLTQVCRSGMRGTGMAGGCGSAVRGIGRAMGGMSILIPLQLVLS